MNPTLIKKLQDFFQKNPITVGEPSTADEFIACGTNYATEIGRNSPIFITTLWRGGNS